MTVAYGVLLCTLVALAGFGVTALVIGARDHNRTATEAGKTALVAVAVVAILMWGVTW